MEIPQFSRKIENCKIFQEDGKSKKILKDGNVEKSRKWTMECLTEDGKLYKIMEIIMSTYSLWLELFLFCYEKFKDILNSRSYALFVLVNQQTCATPWFLWWHQIWLSLKFFFLLGGHIFFKFFSFLLFFLLPIVKLFWLA